MSDLRFDEQQLIGQLGQLIPELRIAFAAACAERLLPAYTHFSERTGRGDDRELAWMLGRLWDDLEGDPMSPFEVQQYIDRCINLSPQADDDAMVEEPPETLEEAVSAARARAEVSIPAMRSEAGWAAEAAAYAFRCRQNREAQEAAWAAQCADEAVYGFVINQEDGAEPRVQTSLQLQAELDRVQSYPLPQSELARQRRDLEELLSVGDGGGVADVIARLRSRAKVEASTVFCDQ